MENIGQEELLVLLLVGQSQGEQPDGPLIARLEERAHPRIDMAAIGTHRVE